ncbi:M4 family metallopeptidase [Clostridium sporogenes]|jgi:Zn-dependent metalloprotease|uniref:Neutral metalloproteinase n=2 Tax=Clostridium TaxID=1485 RepID=A0A0D1BUK3_CLOBO|nr:MULTISPECIES: M4 family metallopeptidase [Clostridium]MBE6076376.1 peptidase M4 family protein [Clostridium lundense]MDU2830952.1 M4 family metallopeptidase [Clostridium botulinum]EDU37329.1 thermolysin metallopeptidase, catalytic domain protein [Clostridium sporogenes ATCC 15579]KIS23457.1 peptidase M4 [Clostridium botulinum B2 450]MCW6094066.1 M4 family metallopeptidase [Clostridium sporogenes]
MKSKKLLATVLSAVITFSAVSAVSAAPVGKESKKEPKTTTISWDKSEQNTKKATTDITQKKFNNSDEITKFFEKNISKFGVKKGSLKNTKAVKDDKGKTHYHMIYQVEGIPVYYGRIVFTTEKDSSMDSINGRIDTAFENESWKNKVKLSKDNAIEKAKSSLKYDNLSKSNADLYLYNFEGKPYVVYLVNLVTNDGDWNVFVNAENGSIVNKFNNTPTLIDNKDQKLPNAEEIKRSSEKAPNINSVINVNGQSTKGQGKTSLNGIVDIDLTYKDGKYYLKDSNKNIYLYDINNSWACLYNYPKSYILRQSNLVENNNNKFTDDKHVVAVDGYVNLSKTYDYYKNKFNRNSIDNKGMNVEGFIHAGKNFNNAFWRDDLGAMFFGDGDGRVFSPLSKSLDIVGHEVSHGVTSKESKLKYENESGALNESFSDIMGVAIDGKNFEIGEECYTPNIPGDTMRDMKDPSRGDQPAHMKDFKYLPNDEDNDWGGVHTNSGIINHAAYLIADGMEKSGEANGKDIMAKLFYRANCYQWDETTNFAKCRNDLIKVTKDLYGENSKHVKIVENAFDQVGITATPQLPL